MLETSILGAFNGADQAYIYIWLSKKHKIVYVGMTNSYTGTIGRAGAHFNRKGTLRKRFVETRGYEVNDVDDILLLSFPLPKTREFTSVEKSYREAVEYLVQKELILLRGKLNPTFDVISWVRLSPRTGNSRIKKLAASIVNSFEANYSRF
jgi:hypothetical protein